MLENELFKERVMNLAKKMFYNDYYDYDVFWEDIPYTLAKMYINDASIKLGWKPEGDRND